MSPCQPCGEGNAAAANYVVIIYVVVIGFLYNTYQFSMLPFRTLGLKF